MWSPKLPLYAAFSWALYTVEVANVTSRLLGKPNIDPYLKLYSLDMRVIYSKYCYYQLNADEEKVTDCAEYKHARLPS